jgi:hypothetical protein
MDDLIAVLLLQMKKEIIKTFFSDEEKYPRTIKTPNKRIFNQRNELHNIYKALMLYQSFPST